MKSFKPGFKTCCQPGEIWTEGHVVSLVEYWWVVALWACLWSPCCEYRHLFSTTSTNIRWFESRHSSIEDTQPYRMTIPHHTLPMWPNAKILEVLSQPAYSPDLATSDENLFRGMRRFKSGLKTGAGCILPIKQPNGISVELRFCHNDGIRQQNRMGDFDALRM